MKKLLSILALAALMISLNACKSSKESTEKSESEKIEATPGKGSVYREEGGVKTKTEATANEGITEETQINETNKLNDQTNFRIIVSFISWGEGTDPEARKKMDICLAENQENTEKNVAFEDMPWGREGEVDFCFTLAELNEEEQENFVTSMKKAFEGNQLVQIYENSLAPHQR